MVCGQSAAGSRRATNCLPSLVTGMGWIGRKCGRRMCSGSDSIVMVVSARKRVARWGRRAETGAGSGAEDEEGKRGRGEEENSDSAYLLVSSSPSLLFTSGFRTVVC